MFQFLQLTYRILFHLRSFHYLFGVSWVKLHNKELLLTTWANRWQNATAITLCSYENATCSLVFFFPIPSFFSPVEFSQESHYRPNQIWLEMAENKSKPIAMKLLIVRPCLYFPIYTLRVFQELIRKHCKTKCRKKLSKL